MSLRRKQPPQSYNEIVAEAEQEAKAWAEWLKPYIDTGLEWVIAERRGKVPTKRRKGARYDVYAEGKCVSISFYDYNGGARVSGHLTAMGYKVKHIQHHQRDRHTIEVYLHPA